MRSVLEPRHRGVITVAPPLGRDRSGRVEAPAGHAFAIEEHDGEQRERADPHRAG